MEPSALSLTYHLVTKSCYGATYMEGHAHGSNAPQYHACTALVLHCSHLLAQPLPPMPVPGLGRTCRSCLCSGLHGLLFCVCNASATCAVGLAPIAAACSCPLATAEWNWHHPGMRHALRQRIYNGAGVYLPMPSCVCTMLLP